MSDAQLNEYLDGELEAALRTRVEAHLEACDACQARLAALESLFEDLAHMSEAPPGRDLAGPVVRSIRARRKESVLIARVAGVQAILAALAAAGGLIWSGGMDLLAEVQRGILQRSEELYLGAALVRQNAVEALAETSQALVTLSTHAPELPASSVPAWLSWWSLLGLALALWLLGNGVLLRERGPRRSH